MQQLDIPLNGPSLNAKCLFYMGKEIGGIVITKLSDNIIDKWVIVKGLYSDTAAVNSTLHRSLRISQTDTDPGYEAVATPTNVPKLL